MVRKATLLQFVYEAEYERDSLPFDIVVVSDVVCAYYSSAISGLTLKKFLRIRSNNGITNY